MGVFDSPFRCLRLSCGGEVGWDYSRSFGKCSFGEEVRIIPSLTFFSVLISSHLRSEQMYIPRLVDTRLSLSTNLLEH